MIKTDTISARTLATYIDHTALKPETTETEIMRLVEEAIEYQFRTVCIDKKWLKTVAPLLSGKAVLPITVIGFPGGAVSTEEKVRESQLALGDGAKELDMVLNRGWMKEKNYKKVFLDISAVVKEAKNVPVKVILETSELSDEEKITACALVVAAGGSFVKTSTGFSAGGATEADIILMRRVVGASFGVKASGGIRNLETALQMIKAGATRLGTSASVAIMKGIQGTGNY